MPPRKRAGGSFVEIRADQFGWDPYRLATLEHSTLPWFERLEASPLDEAVTGGLRERLSLTGQFAAHAAFLRFSGVSIGKFDPAEWSVSRSRGEDARLIRRAATSTQEDGELSTLSAIEAFADFLRVRDSIETFRRSWTKPEAVYLEVIRRIEADARASSRWLRAAAGGWVTSPGPDLLREFISRPAAMRYDEPEIVGKLARFAQFWSAGVRARLKVPVLRLCGTTPLERYSAVSPLSQWSDLEDVAEPIADAIADRIPRALCLIESVDRFDRESRNLVVALMRVAREWSWAVPASGADWLPSHGRADEAPPSRLFVVAPTVSAAEAIDTCVRGIPAASRRDWVSEFVRADRFIDFLGRGILPAAGFSSDSIGEPRRSYLGALGVLGVSTSAGLARQLLIEMGCSVSLEELAIDPIATFDGSTFHFRSESVRRDLIETLSKTSRTSVSIVGARLAEKSGATVAAASLYRDAGAVAQAVGLLEGMDWSESSANEVIANLRDFENIVAHSPRLAAVLSDAHFSVGRYTDAERGAEKAGNTGRVTRARAARRLGEYARALAILDGLESSDATLLRAELLRLTGELDRAERELKSLPGKDPRAEFERALLALDRGQRSEPFLESAPYLAARWRAYSAASAAEYAVADKEAADAEAAATNLPDRIDAALDRLYAAFLAGDWERARHLARRALSLVEETQGDRAAGGVLFTLSYLSADSGYWNEATDAIARLDRFYSQVADERRRSELRMLRAHLAFCRGAFEEARRHLSSGCDPQWSSEIRDAASLIIDEIDWIEKRLSLVRTSGNAHCAELLRRHAVNVARSGGHAALEGFDQTLVQFERDQKTVPPCGSRSQRLRLYRSVLGLLNRRSDDALEKLAREISAEFDLEVLSPERRAGGSAVELQLLQLLSSGQFPDLELRDFQWRFASCNRLGKWRQFGPLPALPESTLSDLDISGAQDWMQCGESDFVFLKGLDGFDSRSREAVRALFSLHLEKFRLSRVAEQERLSVADRPSRGADGILGESAPMRAAVEKTEKVARRDVPVLILGESGTGKELFARAIHSKSARRSAVFNPVNCAALPENLIESELFGHARGAFTGADRDRAGLVEMSDGGTLFLDEIGEMPLFAQAKLLRFLQEGEYRRVGETQIRRADVRVVAATNRKLEQAVDAGKFREDLYYRIRGVDVVIPPLRDRGADILLLASHFLAAEQAKHRNGASRFSDEVEAILLSYAWPGNVRELQNTIRSAHALAVDATQIEPDHLPNKLQEILIVRSPKGNYHEELLRFRRSLIEKSLLQAEGNQNQAAKSLGMTRQALAYQIRELGILVKP